MHNQELFYLLTSPVCFLIEPCLLCYNYEDMKDTEQKPLVLRRTRPKRTKEETAGFVLVIATGGLAVLLGGLYLARHVGQPFDVSYSGPQFFTTAQQEAQEVEEQKTRDTDGDRISDYEELYVLRTSPYLFDTDGDGIDDLTELESDLDPTCPEDADCSNSTFVNPYAESGSLVDSFQTFSGVDGEEVPEEPSVDSALETVAQLSPEEVRELLISSGADEEQVNALTDDQIMALYESVLADLEASGEINTAQ